MTDASSPTPIARRTITAGIAWAAPAIAVATAAPAFASSLRKDPGINGWVLNTTREAWGACAYTLEVDSTRDDFGPDGAPYGLYVYDAEDGDTFTDAKLVYWIIGTQDASWDSLSGHSSCWSAPVKGAPAVKADGRTYTPYTFTYTCPIDAGSRKEDGDGVERLYLGDFHVRARFTQPRDLCGNVTYWTQRYITIDPVGAEGPTTHTFERRNGTLGPYRAGRARALAVEAAEVAAESALPA